ncbi:hypothetical protein NL64_09095 [Pseudomonas fluorescens]|nr:hypothetical protein NL64_09095 [Pseudomonas fluorescens]
MRNLKCFVSAASATATFTADEVIVETALGGLRYCLPSFNKTINLGTTGAGGMDTGTAPISGFVAIYAILNPVTGVSALLAVNATAVVAPEVYGGGNMPAGYTASALLAVVPTNASSQFIACFIEDRECMFPQILVANTAVQIPSFTALSIASATPRNAKSVSGFATVAGTNTTNAQLVLSSALVGIGQLQVGGNSTYGGIQNVSASPFNSLKIILSQTIYWFSTAGSGTYGGATVYISGYRF